MASKKEICEKYEVCGGWSLGAFASLQIHHIQFGIDELLYCSYMYDKDVPASYHRLMIHMAASGRNYVLFGGKRFYLDEAIKI